MAESYVPDEKLLEKYADLLVNFALGSGKGIRKGDCVLLQVPECAKPMLFALRRAVMKAGGHALVHYLPDDYSKEFFELASEDQINFFPDKSIKGRVDQMDHLIVIDSEKDPHELEGVDSKKIMMKHQAFKPYMEWRDKKENEGKFTWTLALYGTEAMAKEAGLSLEDYWQEIIHACHLDHENPIEKWKEIKSEVERVKTKLNALNIEKIKVISEGTDLTIGLGKNRKWMGGTGNNIPSFEVYISPDHRATEGKIKFTEPLYRYGNLIDGVSLEFQNGRVIRASAEKGEEVLGEMISTQGGDKIGEFSLTDARLSRISKFMATTLFDENVGKEFGNTHIALGKSYQDSYPGDVANVSKEQWEEMGYNDSVVHTDIVSTANREVIATLPDGRELVIYKDGKFVI